MTLIKSISGIRGTIGGAPESGLTPPEIIKYSSAYATWIRNTRKGKKHSIVIGRDARLSGDIVNSLVISTLRACGINIIDLGLATTPTVEIAVTDLKADGGIIITASHNPVNWNALKLLNAEGEFISGEDGKSLEAIIESGEFSYSGVENLGSLRSDDTYAEKHINKIVNLPLVEAEKIKEAGFTVVIDSVNSVGGVVLPLLLNRLGVKKVISINGEPTGIFSHNPEPLPENLGGLLDAVKSNGADLGFVVDPDVDRLAIVSEDATFFNEEYTLVACSDYVLSHMGGNTVSNMSSTRALRDVTLKHGGNWYSSAVGEVNVVKKMKEVGAAIGGEGNGGVIYPELHYGRDALVGIALFLSHLAVSGKSCSSLKSTYPSYTISKNRVDLPADADTELLMDKLAGIYSEKLISREDGLLLEDDRGWVHIRRSNTEPIIRIYSEASNRDIADSLSDEIIKSVKKYV